MQCMTADNIAAHTWIQMDLSGKDADPDAVDYKTMYERERVENEMLRTQLKDYQHVLDIEVKENQRRHDKIWDLEEAVNKKERKIRKIKRMLLAALTDA